MKAKPSVRCGDVRGFRQRAGVLGVRVSLKSVFKFTSFRLKVERCHSTEFLCNIEGGNDFCCNQN